VLLSREGPARSHAEFGEEERDKRGTEGREEGSQKDVLVGKITKACCSGGDAVGVGLKGRVHRLQKEGIVSGWRE